MDAAVADLLILSDEVLSPTNTDLGQYWLLFRSPLGANVTLVLDLLEDRAAVIYRAFGASPAISVEVEPIAAARVLDSERRVFELIGGGTQAKPALRCLVAMQGETIVEVSSLAELSL